MQIPDTKYGKAIYAAEMALKELKEANGKQIFAWIKKEKNRFPFDLSEIQPSWGSHLTRAADSPESDIKRVPGKYLYTLSSEEKAARVLKEEEDEAPDASPEKNVRQAQREKRLYALLVEWMNSRGYRSNDTSDLTGGKKWGNPDVLGLLIIEDPMNQEHLELASIEAKVSLRDWRQFFFEAVSHKRFIHRVYFAFAYPADTPQVELIEEYQDLRRYGERYRVGILAVFLTVDTYKKLATGDPEKVILSLEDVRVQEIWPAVYDFVPPIETTEYVRNVLKLNSPTDVRDWGRGD